MREDAGIFEGNWADRKYLMNKRWILVRWWVLGAMVLVGLGCGETAPQYGRVPTPSRGAGEGQNATLTIVLGQFVPVVDMLGTCDSN